MNDIANLAARPFEDNQESNEAVGKVHHYHAHTESCEDCGHTLEEHKYPAQDNDKDKENKGEHDYPAQDNEKDLENKGEHSGEYPGFIRKIR